MKYRDVSNGLLAIFYMHNMCERTVAGRLVNFYLMI